jgi:hypothetical protein
MKVVAFPWHLRRRLAGKSSACATPETRQSVIASLLIVSAPISLSHIVHWNPNFRIGHAYIPSASALNARCINMVLADEGPGEGWWEAIGVTALVGITVFYTILWLVAGH